MVSALRLEELDLENNEFLDEEKANEFFEREKAML